MPRTKDNTKLSTWTKLALAAFAKRNLRVPTSQEVEAAYLVGESPETWAAYADGYSHGRVS